ncbi:MAG: SufS family cysteine desulfurase [Bacteroidota bacterium]
MSPELKEIRKDFPILGQAHPSGKPLVYLDSAASSQKPRVVIEALSDYYLHSHSNIHRGVYHLSQKATALHDAARESVQHFLGAAHPEEIIFVRGATEGINLIAHSLGTRLAKSGSNIVVSLMEHHANFVPWQMLCRETGCELRVIPLSVDGELDLVQAEQLIDANTVILALVHISNSLGTLNPIEKLITQAQVKGAYTLIDGAQSVSHLPIDVQKMGCDFFVFSGHKLFAPTGIGVLYGKKEILEEIPPYQLGGDMIRSVSVERTLFNTLPYKFEAGTPDIGGAVALEKGIEYLEQIGWDWIQEHDRQLLSYATERLQSFPELSVIGQAKNKSSIFSFLFGEVHPHDMGTLLDEEGIAIRTGHHCTMPLMEYLEVPGTARASFSIYNTFEEIDRLVEGLTVVKNIFT